MRIRDSCLGNSQPLVFNTEKALRAGYAQMKKEGESEVSGSQFWKLLVPHKHKLYNFIQKSMNFSEDANDIFQETVMRAFRYFNSYKKEKEFSTWIFTIAHNEVKKYFRKSRKYVFVTNIDRIKSSEQENSYELIQEVYRFAERLKPKQRQVFFLFYYNGFTISEVSQITRIKEGTIKFILNRARNDLKEILGEHNDK